MKLVSVGLGSNSYNIKTGAGILGDLGAACRDLGLSGRPAVVTNPTVAGLYYGAVASSLCAAGYDPFFVEIPDGEQYKNSTTLNLVYDRLIEGGIDRSCFIVALGGGVVGDMAGFAAATFLRGIPFVQVPTTLLAQVDSSVGGKTGIDHPRGKNLIGAFYQPRFVLADVSVLHTLSDREYRAGLAEVVKYGVVLDRPFFEYLEGVVPALDARDSSVLEYLVARCCELKGYVVEQDEKESGLRAVLNYGHTIGHAFEAASGYSAMVHGEAVAIGMAKAAELSKREGLCTESDMKRITDLLVKLSLPVVPPPVSAEEIECLIANDKKSRSGVVSYICNKGIGSHEVRMFAPSELAVFAASAV